MAIETRYARNGDVHLAYQVRSSGAVDLVMPSFGTISIAAFDGERHVARFMQRLGGFARMLCYDLRGIGLSDPISPSSPPTLETFADDAVAVLDKIGCEKAFVFAYFLGGPAAILFAATHPDRVSGLVLCNTYARLERADDYPFGIPRSFLEQWTAGAFGRLSAFRGYIGDRDLIDPDGESDTAEMVTTYAPSMATDAGFQQWWEQEGLRDASPATARAHSSRPSPTYGTSCRRSASRRWSSTAATRCGAGSTTDGTWPSTSRRPSSSRCRRPTCRSSPTRRTWCWASWRSSSRGTGGSSSPTGSSRRSCSPTSPPPPSTRRRSATGRGASSSTGTTSWYGDRSSDSGAARSRPWATGSSPRLTVRRVPSGAAAIRDGARQLGVEIRAGVHTGEVEVRGDDVGGIAVNLAQRVSSVAAGGEVVVSGTVKDLVFGSGIEFAERGPHELKGVPGTWQLYEVLST